MVGSVVAVPSPIELEDVNSSTIKQYGYSPKQQTIRIIFHNGYGYDYPLINPDLWKRFQEADSKGKFLNAQVKPFYAHRKLRDFELGNMTVKEDIELPTLAKLGEIYEAGDDPTEYFARTMYDIADDVKVTTLQTKEAKESILKLSYGEGSRKEEEENEKNDTDDSAR